MSVNNLIREYVRDAIRLTMHESIAGSKAGMSAGQAFKYSYRVRALLSDIMNNSPIKLADGTSVRIPADVNEKLVSSLESGDKNAYTDAFKQGVISYVVDDKGEDVLDVAGNPKLKKITAGSSILKVAAYGGYADKERPDVKSESGFVSTVKKAIEESGGSVSLRLGDVTFDDVTSVEHTGGTKKSGATSKSDVDIISGGKKIGLSFKLPTAEYYLSGDYQLSDIIKPIIDMLQQNVPKEGEVSDKPYIDPKGKTKLVNKGKPSESTTKFQNAIVNKDGKMVEIRFDLPENIKFESVFGYPGNSVDYIVTGDLNATPKVDTNGTYTWNVRITPASLDKIPQEYQPVGLLRHDSGRASMGLKGIRAAVVAEKRAKNAISADTFMERQKNDVKLRRSKRADQLMKNL